MPVELIALGSQSSTEDDLNNLRKLILHFWTSAERGLMFVQLGIDTARLVLLTDASLANARNLKSQMWFIVLVMDHTGRANIVHNGSNQWR